jgi:hypothetical protein
MIGAWRIPPCLKQSETWHSRAGSKFLLVRFAYVLAADLEPTKRPGREKGLKAQYWGTSVNKVNEFYWLISKFSYKYVRVTR